ncbi:BTB/POZ domain-containing protein 6-like [Orbicella faveolata]|uniref:BTB/POZ domain-containing protein 6-like n=1 Tax=Orbicella faveolata TaxID=48498 RepID=UPI0009E2AEFB|nr:BTB/POZ domain-containing protein 6-like [Orbicella faveolata]
MSLDVSSKDLWSATTRSTIRERCQFMFNNELLSDVKFVVRDSEGGSESMKKIPAHKFLLAISSPVFYAMFNGELAEKKDSIAISDCDHKSLLELFRFVYSDEVNLNADNVMQVLYLAKKYMLPSLADKCTEFLGENLDASNVFHVLPDAQKYEEKDLEDHCWEVIDKQADEAVKSDGFVTIEKLVLEALVERDSLNIKEVGLFKAVDCWATKKCEKQGLAAEGSVKRRILGERMVKAIRFPVMEQKEFADVVLDSDILTKKELSDMMKYFSSLLIFPEWCSETIRRGRKRISRFGSGDKLKLGWYYCASAVRNSLVLSVDKNMRLHAARLFGSENNKYSVTLKVTDANRVALATKAGKFLSELMQNEGEEYHGIDIVFKPPAVLQAGKQYFLEASIKGPPSWYGQGGLSHVEHARWSNTFL